MPYSLEDVNQVWKIEKDKKKKIRDTIRGHVLKLYITHDLNYKIAL